MLLIVERGQLLLGGNQMEQQMQIHLVNVPRAEVAMRAIHHRIPDQLVHLLQLQLKELGIIVVKQYKKKRLWLLKD